jgi:hypothetical protein
MRFERFKHPGEADIFRLYAEGMGTTGGNAINTSNLRRGSTSWPRRLGWFSLSSLITFHLPPHYKMLLIPLSYLSA